MEKRKRKSAQVGGAAWARCRRSGSAERKAVGKRRKPGAVMVAGGELRGGERAWRGERERAAAGGRLSASWGVETGAVGRGRRFFEMGFLDEVQVDA